MKKEDFMNHIITMNERNFSLTKEYREQGFAKPNSVVQSTFIYDMV